MRETSGCASRPLIFKPRYSAITLPAFALGVECNEATVEVVSPFPAKRVSPIRPFVENAMFCGGEYHG